MMLSRSSLFVALGALGASAFATGSVLLAACSSSDEPATAAADGGPDGGSGDAKAPAKPKDSGGDDEDVAEIPEGPQSLDGCQVDPGPTAYDNDAGIVDAGADASIDTDPAGGPAKFTITQALEGYPTTPGVLTALIKTENGNIRCILDEAKAPISVANFVGLARGTRPFFDSDLGAWRKGRFFDGLIWHRVVPDFVIQGGDPEGSGNGGPGYDLVKENQVAEPKGALAQAAAAAPSGSQFYIVVGTGPAPDYNVFGTCTTQVAVTIAEVPRNKSNDRPMTNIHMQRIDIARCPAK